MLVHHHKGYNLYKAYKSAMLFDKIMPIYRYAKMDCVDERSVNSLVCVLIIGKSMALHVC